MTMRKSRSLDMKHYLILLSLLPTLASAKCAMINDADQRAYCRALVSESPARCVEIADYNLRQRCKVELGENPANCSTISDAGQRELCRVKYKQR
jgi:hypothetical protein